MNITASMVKELRERTGVGMMECKQALEDASGDMEAAYEALRKKGAAAAEKKAGRIAAEGIIAIAQNDEAASLVEVNCETDFVTKNESFRDFVQSIVELVLKQRPADVEELSALIIKSDGTSVEQMMLELIGTIGEKLSIRRFVIVPVEAGLVSTYLHGNRIGVAVRLKGGNQTLGRDIAMHIAASQPACIAAEDMDPAIIAKEREIYSAQASESGKPDNIIEKMVEGRVKKYLKENTLLGQPFVKNPDQTVEQLLKENEAAIEVMQRFEVGEGMEKRSDDFVAEVMEQAGKS